MKHSPFRVDDKLFYFSRRTLRKIKHWNVSAVGGVRMQNMSETAKTFPGCFSVFVLVFYFKDVMAEIKKGYFCFI